MSRQINILPYVPFKKPFTTPSRMIGTFVLEESENDCIMFVNGGLPIASYGKSLLEV